jgi:hypothetical protein
MPRRVRGVESRSARPSACWRAAPSGSPAGTAPPQLVRRGGSARAQWSEHLGRPLVLPRLDCKDDARPERLLHHRGRLPVWPSRGCNPHTWVALGAPSFAPIPDTFRPFTTRARELDVVRVVRLVRPAREVDGMTEVLRQPRVGRCRDHRARPRAEQLHRRMRQRGGARVWLADFEAEELELEPSGRDPG